MSTLHPVLCSCSWVGDLAIYAPCPSCRASYTARLNEARLEVMHAIAKRKPGDPAVLIKPQMRVWLCDASHRMITPDGPPIAAGDQYAKRPMRAFVLSAAGREVITADGARRLEQTKREIVAESVARHAGMP